MEFREFREAIQRQFAKMSKDATKLFTVDVDKDELWETYMNAYPEGTNNIYRKQREFECSCCRNFIKNIGNVVNIKDGVVTSIWDIQLNVTDDNKFQVVTEAMSAYVKSHAISDVYVKTERAIGTEYNNEQLEDGTILKWEHFYVKLPEMCRNNTHDSNESLMGSYRDTRNVFKRALDEITLDAIDTVLELIASNTLYKGEERKTELKELKKRKTAYDKLATDELRELYAWEKSVTISPTIARIRNSSIGTLLVDISDNVDLDTAVRSYEKIVAPENYKRPKAIFTKRMLEDAKKTIEEMGYTASLPRRFAVLSDITVNNMLFVDRSVASKVNDSDDIFSQMEKMATSTPKKFSKIETISAKDFIKNVLPTASGLEVSLENKHANNMVSLIAPINADAKSMFKWNNGFSWSYNGNVTDSMKDRVKAAGGSVTGDLRFSIQWNEEGLDNCDMDAHCTTPDGTEIYYSHKHDGKSGGTLDVDIIDPKRDVPGADKTAVENITWATRNKMPEGTYKLYVNQYSGHGIKGFRAEVEFDGEIHSFDYNKPTRSKENVMVAEVTLKNGVFTIKECLPSSTSSREIWGLSTNEFVPVTLACYSPNYWDTNAEDDELTGVGNRHLMFMLSGAENPDTPNGMFNEFLMNDLTKHKRVFEALGSQCRVAAESADNQLSGLGFAMTKRSDVTVKVKGQTERVMKIQF